MTYGSTGAAPAPIKKGRKNNIKVENGMTDSRCCVVFQSSLKACVCVTVLVIMDRQGQMQTLGTETLITMSGPCVCISDN